MLSPQMPTSTFAHLIATATDTDYADRMVALADSAGLDLNRLMFVVSLLPRLVREEWSVKP